MRQGDLIGRLHDFQRIDEPAWRVIAPLDFFFALIKGVVIGMTIAMVGLSNGYRATGGPVGVGQAVGRALNLSIIAGVLMNLALSYVFWGTKDTVSL